MTGRQRWGETLSVFN